jgi:hypothetical protein
MPAAPAPAAAAAPVDSEAMLQIIIPKLQANDILEPEEAKLMLRIMNKAKGAPETLTPAERQAVDLQNNQ